MHEYALHAYAEGILAGSRWQLARAKGRGPTQYRMRKGHWYACTVHTDMFVCLSKILNAFIYVYTYLMYSMQSIFWF